VLSHEEQYRLLGVIILVVTVVYIAVTVIWKKLSLHTRLEIVENIIKVRNGTIIIMLCSSVIFFLCYIIMYNLR